MPTRRAVDLMEAKTSEAEELSRTRRSARRRRRAVLLDSSSASEKRRFHEVDGASRQNAAKARGGPTPPLSMRSAGTSARNKKRVGDRADKALNASPNWRVSSEGRSPPPEAGR
jgi:hypothetical protein